MKLYRPRELRLPIDEVRRMIQSNPYVLILTARTLNRQGQEDHSYAIENVTQFDKAFSENYFYPNDTKIVTRTANVIQMVMVPFSLNGDE